MAETSGKAVQVKLVLLGEAAVGKSSLVCRFVQNDFNENTSPTIGAAFSTQKCRLDNRTVKFEIWDTAGQERFHSLAPMYYRNAQAAVIVYDITKATSLEKAKSWVKELQRQASPNIVIALVGNKLDLVAQADASSGSAKPKAKATKTQSSAVGETDAAEGEEAEAAKDGEPETGSDTASVTEDAEAADVEAEAEDSDNPRQISTAEASTYAAEAKLLFTEASAKTGQGIQEIFETIAKAIPIDTPPAAGAAGAAGATGQRSEGQGGRARAREGVDLGEQQAKKVPTSKVSATTKKAKAPAASAGGVTNLGPSFDPFNQGDPFAGSGGKTTSIDASVGSKADKIHIRLQQRNGRKTLTTVQGLPEKYDPKKLLKAMKKEFACNGTVVSSADSDDEDAEGAGAGADDAKAGAKDGGAAKPNFGQILQFQGDQRTAVKEFLVKAGLYSEKEAKDKIVIHGY